MSQVTTYTCVIDDNTCLNPYGHRDVRNCASNGESADMYATGCYHFATEKIVTHMLEQTSHWTPPLFYDRCLGAKVSTSYDSETRDLRYWEPGKPDSESALDALAASLLVGDRDTAARNFAVAGDGTVYRFDFERACNPIEDAGRLGKRFGTPAENVVRLLEVGADVKEECRQRGYSFNSLEDATMELVVDRAERMAGEVDIVEFWRDVRDDPDITLDDQRDRDSFNQLIENVCKASSPGFSPQESHYR